MSYTLEAWTLPGATPHEPVVKEVNWTTANFAQRLNGGDVSCFFDVSADYDRLDHICQPDTNTETLIRCYRDGDYLTSFFARQRNRSHTDGALMTVGGPGIDTGLDLALIYPYDTADPVPAGEWTSVQPDWIFGEGTQLLDNPSFEDSTGTTSWEDGTDDGWELTTEGGQSGLTREANPLTQVIATANARTGANAFTLVSPAPRQSGIQKRFTCTPGGRYQISVWVLSFTAGRRATMFMTVEAGYTIHHTNGWFYRGTAGAELGNDPRNTGATNGATYEQIQLDVTVGDDQTSFIVTIMDDHLTDTVAPDYFVDDFSIDGPGLGLVPWDVMEATYEQDTAHVHEGTYAVKVTADGTQPADGTAVVQRLTDGVPGVVYTFAAWVYHEEASNRSFRAIIKRTNGTEGANVLTSVPPNTWTRLWVTAEMNTTTLSFLVRLVGTFAMSFWMDDTWAYEGFQPTTPGDVVQQLFVPIWLRGSTEWLHADTFDDVTDSNGVAWSTTISVRINRGRTMRQAIDLILPWVEWYIWWDGTDYQLMLYNRNGAGTDRRALDTPKLGVGRGYQSADVARRGPAVNTGLVEGADLRFRQVTNPTLSAAYQRREGYVGQREIRGGLAAVGQAMVEDSRRNTFDARPQYTDQDANALDVWTGLRLGDLVNADLPPDLVEGEARVVGFSTVLTAGEDEPSVTHVIETTPITTSGAT